MKLMMGGKQVQKAELHEEIALADKLKLFWNCELKTVKQ